MKNRKASKKHKSGSYLSPCLGTGQRLTKAERVKSQLVRVEKVGRFHRVAVRELKGSTVKEMHFVGAMPGHAKRIRGLWNRI